MTKKNKVKTVPVESTLESTPMVPRVEFHVWFALREKKIPRHHMSEILLADFKGQGLTAKETIETFDRALATYGVKL